MQFLCFFNEKMRIFLVFTATKFDLDNSASLHSLSAVLDKYMYVKSALKPPIQLFILFYFFTPSLELKRQALLEAFLEYLSNVKDDDTKRDYFRCVHIKRRRLSYSESKSELYCA